MRDPSDPEGADLPDSESATVIASSFTTGQVLGKRYRLISMLGRGGMGEVWHTYDLKLQLEVALKSVRPELSADARAMQTLRQEVRAAREVISPHVCRLFDLVEADGLELVSMEYVEGVTLLEHLEKHGPLELREATEIASQMLAGLEAIHQAGLVHRDIKPENIMISRAGRVVVMDLGIARPVDSERVTIAGTPAYMAPEQLRGEAVDARSDVFAAGVVLAELTGPEGTARPKAREAIWRCAHQEPPQLPDGPWRVILTKAVARDPNQRHASAAALARALETVSLRQEAAQDVRPYPGLTAFTQHDAAFFFGREREIETVLHKLRQPHLQALIGPSGAGKSSFLRAGILPTLPTDWAVVICTPGERPLKNLVQALLPEISGDAEAMQLLLDVEDPEAAVRLFARWRQKHANVLVIVDQFEELFTQNPPEVQTSFANLLGHLALDADVHVMLSLRDDFLLYCHDQQALQPIFTELTPLKAPAGEALRRAVVQPARKCGYRFEDENLVDEMLAEVADERGALPLLAFAMAQLWERRDRDQGLLTRRAYQEIGGVGGALAGHAEATLERIGIERIPLVRELFRNLVTAQGTRAVRDRQDLLSVFPDRTVAADILDALIDARLLTSFEIAGDEGREGEAAAAGSAGSAGTVVGDIDGGRRQQVEIVHESLLSAWPRLVRWQTQDADGAQLRDQLRQAAQMWEERGQPVDLLWTGTSFREFALWTERYPGGLSETEEAFGRAMTARVHGQRRRRRLVVAGAFTALLAVLAVVFFSRQQAVRHASEAEANYLLALGRTNLAENNSYTLAHTIASLEKADSPAARRLALEALWQGPTMFTVLGTGSWGLDFSPDGAWLAVGQDDGEVQLWFAGGTRKRPLLGHNNYVQICRFDPNSKYLATCSPIEGTLCVWSLPNRDLVFETDGVQAFRWSQDGHHIFTYNEGEWQSWTLDGWRSAPLGRAGGLGKLGWPVFATVDVSGTWSADCRDAELYLVPLGQQASGTARYLGSHTGMIELAAFDEIGKQIASIDVGGEVRVWPFANASADPKHLTGQHLDVVSMRFLASGRYLATTGGDFTARLWDLTGLTRADPLVLRQRGQLNQLALHPNGNWATIASRMLTFWPLTRHYPLILRGHSVRVIGLHFTPDGSWLASASVDGTVRLWSLSNGELPGCRVLGETDADMYCMAGEPTGNRLLAGTVSGSIWSVTLPNGTLEQIVPPINNRLVGCVALAPGGRLAATSCEWYNDNQSTIRVWDLETGQQNSLDVAAGKKVRDLRFLPDGRLLVGGDSGLRVWDHMKSEYDVLRDSTVWQVSVSKNGQRVLSTGLSGGVQIHALAGDQSAELSREQSSDQPLEQAFDLTPGQTFELTAHGNFYFGEISPDGTVVVTGASTSGELRVGPVTGEEPHLLIRHAGGISAVAIDPVGRWVASGGDDGTIRLWPIPSGKPFHTLPRDIFLARLKALTNLRVEPDDTRESGYRLDFGGKFPGWDDAPTW